VGLDRIGWWYYRAGRAPTAVGLLSKLVGVTPNSEEVILELAWAQLESGSAPPALAGFRRSRTNQNEWRPRADDPAMGLALASWLFRQQEEALREYNLAIQQHPEWQNAAWVAALGVSSALTRLAVKANATAVASIAPATLVFFIVRDLPSSVKSAAIAAVDL